jgi:uncharacterized protein with GYD domain
MYHWSEMAHYIILWNFTDEGLKGVRESTNRSESFKSMAEKAGCKLIGTYYTMGLYDGVSLIEAPDDATVMKTLLSFESQMGSSRTITLKAFTAEETADILRNLS